ncbi:MAG: RuvX/YqgF family protein [Candidatus Riflebacteria bacterium]|nr:RuvX/YqgF family protein [Candidatus Riflebacteria bacterium]
MADVPDPIPVPAPVVLAVDPGTDKIGWAVVGYDLRVHEQGIAFVSEFHRVVKRVIAERRPEIMVMGAGTAGALVMKVLCDLQVELPVRIGDEYKTTEEARRRYFADHPPTGLWRLVPLGLQLPPRPVDDYAAVIIAERYLRTNGLATRIPGT